MRFQGLARLPFAALACSVLAGCGGFDYLAATTVAPPASPADSATTGGKSNNAIVTGPIGPGEKVVTLPMSSSDYICPIVSVRDGGAALRVGGPSNDSVRYQLQINDTARECDPAGQGQVAIKVGVSGALLIGPAGSPGSYGGDLRISIVHDADKKVAFEQSYKAAATTDASGQASFQIVTDPVTLPVASPDVADEYSIYVGFGAGPDVAQGKGKRKKKQAALTTPTQ
jgi:hypothetical protein